MTTDATQLGQTGTFKHRRVAAIVTFLLAVGIPIAGILTADVRGAEVAPGLGDWIFVAIVGAVALATFGLLVPWALSGQGSRTGGLAVSLLAFMFSFVAVWTMVPLILGAAGALIGYETFSASAGTTRRGLGAASVTLGTIAMVVSIAATIATS